MAAGRKTGGRQNFKFYVYEILDADGDVIYVGKGMRGRMRASMLERGGESCREVARFNDEDAAYAYEVERISGYTGLLNKNSGGIGGRFGNYKAPVVYKPDWTLTKPALVGIAKCLKYKEAGYALYMAGMDLCEYAAQSLKRYVGEFGKDAVFEQLAIHGVDGGRHV